MIRRMLRNCLARIGRSCATRRGPRHFRWVVVLAPQLCLGMPVDEARAQVAESRAPLDPKPAHLVIEGTSGAEIYVDGVAVGNLPLIDPIRVSPGKHRVRAKLNGHLPYEQTVSIGRGSRVRLQIELEATGQRTLAWLAIGTGAASAGVGIVFGVLSVVEHRISRDLVQFSFQSEDQQAEFNAAIRARDNYRIVSGVAGGVGLAAFVTGAALFSFDEPAWGSARPYLRFIPVWTPSWAGAVVASEF